MKKIITLLISAMMILALCVPAFAAEAPKEEAPEAPAPAKSIIPDIPKKPEEPSKEPDGGNEG